MNKTELLKSVTQAKSFEALEQIRVALLGKKGTITAQMKTLGSLSPAQRKDAGKKLNQLKNTISTAIEARRVVLKAEHLDRKVQEDILDVTLPVRPERRGCVHPLTKVINDCVSIFSQMGFEVVEGPEIEDDFHNFTALNIAEEHPARQMHDTFYFPDGKLLRTHTSSVQIRAMCGGKPPFRLIAPGRTYRSDYDMTHTPMFHQIEGLLVEEAVHMGHLKGCLTDFLQRFFEQEYIPVRFRPSYFPFTEPSAEVDIGCKHGDGGLKIGAGTDWLEILGCGMIHPNVLENCGIDSKKYQGFAFGMGIERLAMLKYDISDMRTFFESDTRWLAHYGFGAEEA